MKKEEFVALGISEELAAKAEEASKTELAGYVPKSRFDEVNESKKKLETSANDYKTQLENLKTTAGDNEALKQQIAELQAQNKQKEEEYQKELKDLQLTNAIKTAISASAQDSDLVAGLIDKTKLILGDDGKVTGLEEQVKALKESKAFLFKPEDGGNGGKDGKGGNGQKGYGFQVGSSGSQGGQDNGGTQASMRDAIAAKLKAQMGQP